jgi:hypothetical protein
MQLTLALVDVEMACFGFNGPAKFSALADKPMPYAVAMEITPPRISLLNLIF